MTELLRETELEGSLIAHRKILHILLQCVAQLHPQPELFWAQFDEHLTIQNHEEDPGIEPDQAFATQAAIAFEIQNIVESARKPLA